MLVIKGVFPASVDQLHVMLQFVTMNARLSGFESGQFLQIELALEEVIVNIIEHGYKNSSGSIEIQCSFTETGLEVKLSDRGFPFNPLMPLEGPVIGGYGLPLLTKIVDRFEYEYTNDQNLLTLIWKNRH